MVNNAVASSSKALAPKYAFFSDKLGGAEIKPKYDKALKEWSYKTPDGSTVTYGNDGRVMVSMDLKVHTHSKEDVQNKINELRKIEKERTLAGQKGLMGWEFNSDSAKERGLVTQALTKMGYNNDWKVHFNDGRRDNPHVNDYEYDPNATVSVVGSGNGYWEKYKK